MQKVPPPRPTTIVWFGGVCFVNMSAFKKATFFLCVLMILVCQEQNCDSGVGFKGKVESQDPTSRDCEFRSSTRTKIMNFHDFNFALFSLLILKMSSSWSAILEVSWSKIIEKTVRRVQKVPPPRPATI